MIDGEFPTKKSLLSIDSFAYTSLLAITLLLSIPQLLLSMPHAPSVYATDYCSTQKILKI